MPKSTQKKDQPSDALLNFLRIVKGAVDPNGFVDQNGLNAAWAELTGEGDEEPTEDETEA